MKKIFILCLFTSFKVGAGNWDGVYQTACASKEDNFLYSQVNISNNYFENSFLVAEDESCSQVYLKYSINYKFSIHGYSWDGEVVGVTYTPMTAEVAEALSGIGFCGFNDWIQWEPKDVTGLDCQNYSVPPKGEKFYSIIREEVSRPGFRMGRSSEGRDGLSRETRFVEWSDYWFEKVK